MGHGQGPCRAPLPPNAQLCCAVACAIASYGAAVRVGSSGEGCCCIPLGPPPAAAAAALAGLPLLRLDGCPPLISSSVLYAHPPPMLPLASQPHLPRAHPLPIPRLRAKPVRTASGIAVVAVMSKPHRCPHIATTGNICVYCPGGPDSDFEYSTQSYTGVWGGGIGRREQVKRGVGAGDGQPSCMQPMLLQLWRDPRVDRIVSSLQCCCDCLSGSATLGTRATAPQPHPPTPQHRHTHTLAHTHTPAPPQDMSPHRCAPSELGTTRMCR